MLVGYRSVCLLARLCALYRRASLSTAVNIGYSRKRFLQPATTTLFAISRAMEHTDLNYKDLIEARKSRDVLLIDVRNPDEREAGFIPNTINVPLGELEAALKMDDKEFEDHYKHKKPQKDTEIIFSCRSGNRSRRALNLALALGFDKSKHYIGGWLDWEEQTKNKD